MFYQAVYDGLRGSGANGEANALGAAYYCCVDADDFAVKVDEGSATVAVVDGGISLDEVIQVAALGADGASARADDAQRNRGASLEGERVTQRNNPVAHVDVVGIAHRYRGQVLFVNLEDGKVRDDVASHYLGVVGLAVGQVDLDVVRALNHMEVGHDVAVGTNDHAGACALIGKVEEHAAADRLYRYGRDGGLYFVNKAGY